jgi:hypothetical protein
MPAPESATEIDTSSPRLEPACEDGDPVSQVDVSLLVNFPERTERAEQKDKRQRSYRNRQEYARLDPGWRV